MYILLLAVKYSYFETKCDLYIAVRDKYLYCTMYLYFVLHLYAVYNRMVLVGLLIFNVGKCVLIRTEFF